MTIFHYELLCIVSLPIKKLALLTIASGTIGIQSVPISTRALECNSSIHTELLTVVGAFSTLIDSCVGKD